MRSRPLFLPGLLALGFATLPAHAHHSAAPHFDLEKTVTLEGTITKFEFVNPHGYVYFSVRDAGGKSQQWRCELASRTSLMRLGWTQNTFTPGHKVTIKGAPARREDNVCMLSSFVTEDGREITRDGDLTQSGATTPIAANGSAKISSRPARLPNGQPNLQGPWVGMGGPDGRGPGPGDKGKEGKNKEAKAKDFKGKGDKGKGPPNAPQATEAGQIAAQSYDQRFDDPAIKCNPANILFGWTHDRHVNEIVQKSDAITIKYGYMDFVRTVRLNMTEHPKNTKPSTGGHSIGHWEGDVLVVDTIGFAPSVLIPIMGLMHSGQMHVVERFSVDPNEGILTRTYRAEDPLYLKGPYTGVDRMALSAEPYVPYNCVELSGKNNIRPK